MAKVTFRILELLRARRNGAFSAEKLVVCESLRDHYNELLRRYLRLPAGGQQCSRLSTNVQLGHVTELHHATIIKTAPLFEAQLRPSSLPDRRQCPLSADDSDRTKTMPSMLGS